MKPYSRKSLSSRAGTTGLSAQLAVYNPGNIRVTADKNMSLMYCVKDVTAEYERLLRELPGLAVTSPPERRPWGAFSCWFLDPDGNTVSLIEQNDTGKADTQ